MFAPQGRSLSPQNHLWCFTSEPLRGSSSTSYACAPLASGTSLPIEPFQVSLWIPHPSGQGNSQARSGRARPARPNEVTKCPWGARGISASMPVISRDIYTPLRGASASMHVVPDLRDTLSVNLCESLGHLAHVQPFI